MQSERNCHQHNRFYATDSRALFGGKWKVQNKLGDRGSTVVKVLCYKSEGCWLDPSWYQWIFH